MNSNTLIVFFIFVPILAFILLFINILLAPNKPDAEKNSTYECGFLTISGQTRVPFTIPYYNVTVCFLLFDVELTLVFPSAISFNEIGPYGLSSLLVFLLVLTIGFILEIGSGAIQLTNQNTNDTFNQFTNTNIPKKN